MITLLLKKVPGQLAFVPPENTREREQLKQILRKCIEKYNGYVSVSFDIPKKKRTTGKHSQNSCIYGYAQCIANFTGDDVSSILIVAKRRAFKRGYPPKINDDGEVMYSLLDGEPIPESSAKISTIEAGYLIDELIQIASELDIILPKTMEEKI